MQPPLHLETERLVLRAPRLADAEAIYRRWASDPEVPRYMTWTPHKSPSETISFVERCLQDADAGRGYHWMLTERGGNDEPIGAISVSRDNAFCVHLGYVIARSDGYRVEDRGFSTLGSFSGIDEPAPVLAAAALMLLDPPLLP